MALTSSGSTNAAAANVEQQGATRQQRLAARAAEAGPGSATPAQGPAFIDGDQFSSASQAADVRPAGNVDGPGPGFIGEGQPNPNNPAGTNPGSQSAPIVNRQARVSGGQAGDTSSPGNSAGFPFQVPGARQT